MTDSDSIFLTGGVGDVLAIESHFSDEQRRKLNTIYYASPKYKQLQKLFAALPNYPNLKNHTVIWSDFKNFNCFYSKEDFLEQTKTQLTAVLENATDWSIQKCFPTISKGDINYNYSSFIRYTVADIDKFKLPKNIVTICPFSNNNATDIYDRNFDAEDWKATIFYLKKTGMIGVVVNQGNDVIPQHPLIINLNNKSTFLESFEILKASKGYVGIDSALSVLAAKLFSAPHLMIRSKNKHLYSWQHIYYQPKNEYNFVSDSINKLVRGKNKQFPYISLNKHLNICPGHGLAFQKDMSQSVPYDEEYYENYCQLENTPIANKLNTARTKITEKYCSCLIDIGIGSGEFIKKSKIKVYGYDINPYGIDWLKERKLFVDIYNETIPEEVRGWTLWDTLEHIPDHRPLFSKIRLNDYVFVSLPTFNDLMALEESKHYKPNEHYYYFTPLGFIKYMAECGFDCQEFNRAETEAGRENVMTFALKKVREINNFSFVKIR